MDSISPLKLDPNFDTICNPRHPLDEEGREKKREGEAKLISANFRPQILNQEQSTVISYLVDTHNAFKYEHNFKRVWTYLPDQSDDMHLTSKYCSR